MEFNKTKDGLVNFFFSKKYLAFLFPFLREFYYWYRIATYKIKVVDFVSLKRNIPEKKDDAKLSILFVTGYGIGSHYHAVEPPLVNALKAQGHNVNSLICGKAFSCCEFNADCGANSSNTPLSHRRGITSKARSRFGTSCVNNVTNQHIKDGIRTISLKQYDDQPLFPTEEDIANKLLSSTNNFRDIIYKGIAVGEEAFASILRVTFTGEVSDRFNNTSLIKKYLINAIRATEYYSHAFEDLQPDRICLIHGIYQIHGIATKVANKLNIPVVVIGGGGIRKNTIICCHGETYHHQLVNEDNIIWENTNLSKEMRIKVLNYADAKRNNGAAVDYLNYHPSPINNFDEISKELGCDFKSYDRIITLFTNVLWDAQILYDTQLFDNLQDWLLSTIQIAKKNSKSLYLIRVHPAEVKTANPSRQPIIKEITCLKNLPANVILISPYSNIDSYKLAEISDVNVIYGTKMGLEIALMKRNLVVVGESFSKGKGYGYDPTSVDDYARSLYFNPSEKEINFRYERALKYAHYLYFQRMLDLPSAENKTDLKCFIDGVENLKPFINRE